MKTISKQNHPKQKRSGTAKSTTRRKSIGAVRTVPTTTADILELAELRYIHDEEAFIVELLAPLEKASNDFSAKDRTQYLSLLAMGHAHTSNLIEAEETANKLVRHQPQSPDPWFVLTYVRLTMREYNLAIEAAEKYIELLGGLDHAGSDIGKVYGATPGHQSQTYNMYAAACKESGRTNDAITYYRRAIELDSGNHLPYLNLATLFSSLCRVAEAKEVIKRGVRNARQVQELRMMQQSLKTRATVSACMIVKNEEELLGDCLQSIRDWVDEIIVVDTGSTDKTVEIAQSFGAKIYHHAWEGDFSKARNQSLSYATHDWIFIIDADERIFAEDVAQLKRLLDDSRAEVISLNVYNVYRDNASAVTFLPSPRLFRRSLGLHYDGIVHNTLMYAESQPIKRTGVRLKHLGYGLDKEKMRKKLERSRALLEKQLAENPDNAFALFNYAQLLRGETATFPAQNAELILTSARRAVELTSPELATERHLHLMCLDQIAWALFQQEKFDQALEYAQRAISHKSNYLDPLLLLGHIAARRQDYDQACIHYAAYLKAQAAYDPVRETDNIIMLHVDSRISAWSSLGIIAELKGDTTLAEEYYERIDQMNPGHLDTCANLGRLALQRNDVTGAAGYYLKHLQYHPDALEIYGSLGQLYLSSHHYVEAEETFRNGLKQNAIDVACITGLGRTLAEMGKVDKARAVLDGALKSIPADQSIQRELASVLFRAGLFLEASNLLGKLIQQLPKDAELLNDYGNSCVKLGQLVKAIAAYRQALDCPNPPAIVWRNLGIASARSNDLDGAAHAFETYLQYDPDSPEIIRLLIDIQMTSGRYEQALAQLERFLKVNPQDALMMFQLAECYLLMGHTDSAILGYRRVLQLDPMSSKAEDRIAALSATAVVAR